MTKLNELIFIHSTPNNYEWCYDFVFKYENINTFSMGPLKDKHLLKLFGKYPRLAEAYFDFNEDVNVQIVIEFVEKSPILNKFTFNRAGNLRDFLKEFTNHYSLERKVPIAKQPGNIASKFTAHLLLQ